MNPEPHCVHVYAHVNLNPCAEHTDVDIKVIPNWTLCCFPSTGALRIADGDIIHTVIDFLSYLKLKGKRKVLHKLLLASK